MYKETRSLTVQELKSFLSTIPDDSFIVVGAEGSFSIPGEEMLSVEYDDDENTVTINWDD